MKDGGPAFGGAYDDVLICEGHPEFEPRKLERRVRGMSLRDYFAAAMLTGLTVSGQIPFRTTHQTTLDDDDDRAYSASEIYAMADAMLAAREKQC